MEYLDNIKTANELAEYETNWQEKDMNKVDRSVDPDYEDSMRSVMDKERGHIPVFGDADFESSFIHMVAGEHSPDDRRERPRVQPRVNAAAIARTLWDLRYTSEEIRELISS